MIVKVAVAFRLLVRQRLIEAARHQADNGQYYGTQMMLAILATFSATMVIAAYIVEFLFSAARLVPAERAARVAEEGIQWNYTTVLNIIFLLLAAALLVRFFRSGGRPMLRMMDGSPDEPQHAHHAACEEGLERAAIPRA